MIRPDRSPSEPLPIVNNILETITAHKRDEIAAARQRCPIEQLQQRLAAAPPVRDFVGALRSAPGGLGLIAEIKRASPSAGLIRPDFDPVSIAQTYQSHGAACLSVLTDEQFFQGHLDDLTAVHRAVSLPVLRKDFLLDRYQVLEARVAGADCVLLITECLSDDQLRDLSGYAAELGMAALIEVYEPQNLDRILTLDPPLVGVNNRNLQTFETSLEHSIEMAGRIPDGVLLVSESGIGNRDDVVRLQRAGVRAILVGETLMRATDIGHKVDELLGHT